MEIQVKNKILIIKGILAEECGLMPEMYDKLSTELDELRDLVLSKSSALANAGTSEKDLTGMQSYGGVLGCHIGHNTTVIEHLVRAVENKTGETIICVNMHKDEMDFFNKPIVDKEPFIIQAIDRSCCQMLPIEKPSHIRPYKFHR